MAARTETFCGRGVAAGELSDEELYPGVAQWAGLYDRMIEREEDETERRFRIAADHGAVGLLNHEKHERHEKGKGHGRWLREFLLFVLFVSFVVPSSAERLTFSRGTIGGIGVARAGGMG